MPFITTNRMQFHYRDCGQSGGEPVLFVHGGFATSRWWEPVLNRLPDQYYAIAPDLRGAGQSQHSESGYDIPGQAADLHALVEALDLDPVHLVGHSLGGAIAMQYALDYPQDLRSLVLVDTAPGEGVFTPPEVYEILERMRTDRSLLTQALSSLMPTHPPDEFLQQLVEDATQIAPPLFTAGAHALEEWNVSERLPQITLPTLLIWGEQDIMVDREATERTLLAIRGAGNLEVFHGSGHCPHIEQPDAFVESLLAFIAEDFDTFADIRGSVDEE